MAEDNKPKAVVQGKASTRSLFGKIGEIFTLGNMKDARNYIISDVLVPGVLDILYDSVTRYAGKLIYGDKGIPARDRRNKIGGTNYNGIVRLSDGESIRSFKKKQENSVVSGIYDYNEIELRTRADAEMLLDAMTDFLESHDVITVADMYAMAHYEGGNYTDNNWGWADLKGARVERSLDGWILKLPRVMNIKDIK